MKMRWQMKTGLAKAAVICAAGLVLSAGLCGFNTAIWNDNSSFLLPAGMLELLAMVAFAVALLVVALIALIKRLARIFSHRPQDEQ